MSGGGTAIIIDGDNATIKYRPGTFNISGAVSTGTVINGNSARISNDGDMNITDGAIGNTLPVITRLSITPGTTARARTQRRCTSTATMRSLSRRRPDHPVVPPVRKFDGDGARIANTGDIAVDGAGPCRRGHQWRQRQPDLCGRFAGHRRRRVHRLANGTAMR